MLVPTQPPRRRDRMNLAHESANRAAVESVGATLQLYFDGLYNQSAVLIPNELLVKVAQDSVERRLP